ncbi:ATPase with role in protein import into the ER [Marasmius tenuissimus]|uniref:ATPase with role in protein import into the ER n=1 Tax=Marasmius tenuissimus TaxID=585030 RepID=A0ABR2ZFJ7_9AGAR
MGTFSASGISTFAPTLASNSLTTVPTSNPMTTTTPTSSATVVPGAIATISVTPSSTRKTIVVVEAVFGGIGGTFILVLTLACCYKKWRARRRRCNEEDPAMVEEKAHSRSSDLMTTVSDTPGVVLRDSKSTLEESVEGNEACGHGRNDQIPENEQPSPSDRRRKNAIQPREVYEHPMSMVLSSSNLHFLYSEGGRNGPSSHLSESGGLQPEPSRVSKVVSNADVEEVSDSNDSFVEAGDCEVETEEREIVVSSPAEAEETGHGAIISVDLGTSYTRVGVLKGGKIEIIPNEFGDLVTPSCIGFNGDERLVGKSAQKALLTNPETTLINAKRLIGRTTDDKGKEPESSSFRVHNKNGKPVVNVQYRGGNKDFLPEELTAMILSSMKEIAEAYLGEKVTHAVVTVPACEFLPFIQLILTIDNSGSMIRGFNDAQRQATKDAGTIAGLTILRLMNDPTAAALAYGVHQNNAPGSKIIVYDLGGGTFDVSLLSVKEDGVFEVLGTAGDAHLGGEDFDERVMRYLVEAHTSRTGRDVSDDSAAMSRLKMEVEKAKVILSRKPSATIKIEDFGDGGRLVETLTRDQFEELNSDLFDQTMNSVNRVLVDAGTTKDEVDEVRLPKYPV